MFKSGQIVRVIKYYDHPFAMGELLKVATEVKIGTNIGVVKEGWIGGHNLNGRLKDDSGWWIPERCIEKVNEEMPNNESPFYIIVPNHNSKEIQSYYDSKAAYIITENGHNVAIYWDKGKKTIINNPLIISKTNDLSIGISIKVKSYEISNSLMTGKKKRRELFGQIFPLITTYKKTLGGQERLIYNLNANNVPISVLAEDCEIIYPTLQGYNFPKDRTIKVGSSVKCVNDRCLSKKIYGERFEVMEVTSRSSDSRIILTLKDTKGNITKEYKDKFKLIN